MPRRPPPAAACSTKPVGRSGDLSPRDFRDALIDNGFAYLGGSVDKYIDLRHPKRGTVPPIKAGKLTLRRETFDALLASRRSAAIEKSLADAERRRVETVAAAIAPSALPPCRADLTDEAAIAQLADDFTVRSATSDGVGWSDLIQMGWRGEQLKTHAEAARAVADRRQSMVLA